MFDKAGLGYRPNKQQKLYKNFFAFTQKNTYPLLTCFTVETKDIVHLHAILRKIVIILKWYGFQKNLLWKLTFKDPRKFGYLSHKHDYIGFFKEELVH